MLQFANVALHVNAPRDEIPANLSDNSSESSGDDGNPHQITLPSVHIISSSEASTRKDDESIPYLMCIEVTPQYSTDSDSSEGDGGDFKDSPTKLNDKVRITPLKTIREVQWRYLADPQILLATAEPSQYITSNCSFDTSRPSNPWGPPTSFSNMPYNSHLPSDSNADEENHERTCPHNPYNPCDCNTAMGERQYVKRPPQTSAIEIQYQDWFDESFEEGKEMYSHKNESRQKAQEPAPLEYMGEYEPSLEECDQNFSNNPHYSENYQKNPNSDVD